MGLVEGAIGMGASYRDLRVWQQAMELVVETYKQTRDFPKTEIYGLTSQMRRAAVSIPSNIAEGKGRSTDRDRAHFFCHARGSLLELETQILIAQRLGVPRPGASRRVAERFGALRTHAERSCPIAQNSRRYPRRHRRLKSNV
jgi:four helix bundle protein